MISTQYESEVHGCGRKTTRHGHMLSERCKVTDRSPYGLRRLLI